MRSLGDVICWALALLMLLLALAIYKHSQLIALFALAGMVLVLPPTGRSIAQKTGFGGRFKQVVVGLLIGILGGPIAAGITAGFTTEGTDQAAATAQTDGQKPAQAEAKRLEDKAAMEAREAKWAQEQANAAAKREARAKAEVVAYIDRLELEIESIPDVRPATYVNGLAPINAGLAVIGAWAAVYEQGSRLELDAETEKKRQKFRALVVKKQARMLPAMRDAYGPAMRQQLWEADGSAKTFGPGFRTIEFVSAAFARNANIKKIHEQMQEALTMLRFSRAQYKWFDGASEYSYYTLEPPKDSDVVRWNPNGTFRVLD